MNITSGQPLVGSRSAEPDSRGRFLRVRDIAIDMAVLLAVAIAYLRPLLNFDPSLLPAGPEFEGHVALDELFVQSMRRFGEVPLWNPLIHTGFPYVADPFTNIFNPLAGASFLLFGASNGSKVAILAAVFVAGAGQYLLCSYLRLNRGVRLWSAAMMIVSGGLTARLYGGDLDLALAEAWIPAAYALTAITLSKRRLLFAPVAAASLAIMFFSGSFYYFFYISVCLCVMAAFYLLRPTAVGVGLDARAVKLFVMIFGITAGLIAIQLLPMLELYPLLIKPVDPNIAASQPPVWSLISYVVSDASLFGKLPGSLPFPGTFYIYIGSLPFLFLLFLVPALRRENARGVVMIAVLAGFALAWASARYTFFFNLYQTFPFLYSIRFTALAMSLVTPLLLALCAVGLQWLWDRASQIRTSIAMVARMNGASGDGSAQPESSPPVNLRVRHFAALLVLLLAVQSVQEPFITNSKLLSLRPRDPAHDRLMGWLRQSDPSTYYVSAYGGFTIWGSSLVMYEQGIKYLSSAYAWDMGKIYPAGADAASGRGVLFPGPKYQIVTRDVQLPPPARRIHESDPFAIYLMPNSLPYSFLTDESAVPYGRGTALPQGAASVDVQWRGANRFEARGQSDKPGQVLVALESYYPGWRVAVDGVDRGPARNIGGYLGASADLGDHGYQFVFSSTPFGIGALITLLAGLVAAGLVAFDLGLLSGAVSASRRYRRRLAPAGQG